MTPYQCELLIHVHTRSTIDGIADTPLRQETLRAFSNEGAVHFHEGRWRLTPLGEAWLLDLLATPAPEARYSNQHGEEIARDSHHDSACAAYGRSFVKKDGAVTAAELVEALEQVAARLAAWADDIPEDLEALERANALIAKHRPGGEA